MRQNSGWICIMVDSKCIKRGKAPVLIKGELEKIFGEDFEQLVFAGAKLSGEVFENFVENYAFVKCRNYFNHIKGLKKSKVITSVVNDFSDPCFCDEKEVLGFIKSVGVEKAKFDYADVVVVREGYLKGMNGIILRKDKKRDYYQVFFRLYTRQFVESIKSSNLVYQTSFLDRLRFPMKLKKDGRRWVRV